MVDMTKFNVGYTTGVFDLFHIGHLNILKNSKSICNELIVGVATDELAENLKGKKPFVPFDERAEIVKNIKCVDRIVPQAIIDEVNDYYLYKFDVIIKGDDWKGTEKWNVLEKRLNAIGVKVVFFPYTKNISSSKTREWLSSIESNSFQM